MNLTNNVTIAGEPDAKLQEAYLAISVCLLVLLLGIFITTYLRVHQVYYVAEAFALVVLGVLIGAIMHGAQNDAIMGGVVKLIEFDNSLFFIILLPPIIFNSGLELNQERFSQNFGLICALAFVGTLISALVVGSIMYAAGQSGLVYRTTVTESYTFGSLISATDPVTVIAVFQTLNVRSDLLALVIGESVLNDAVAIVLYNTVTSITNTSQGFVFFSLNGILSFLGIFFGSVAVGIGIAVLGTLIFKVFARLQRPSLHLVEASIVLLFPYVAYCLSEGLELSGIVSILFCGLTMSRYTQHNMTKKGKHFLYEVYGTFAFLAESFIFVYLGLAVFTAEDKFIWVEWEFSLMAFAACMCSRFASVVPLCLLSNICRRKKLHAKDIFILWFSGLRGGIAYALAADSSRLPDSVIRNQTGYVFQEATTFVTILGLALFGNTLASVVTCLDLAEHSPAQKWSLNGSGSSNSSGIEMSQLQHQTSSYSSLGSVSSRIENEFIKPFLLKRNSRTDELVDSDPIAANPNGTTTIELSESSSEPIGKDSDKVVVQ